MKEWKWSFINVWLSFRWYEIRHRLYNCFNFRYWMQFYFFLYFYFDYNSYRTYEPFIRFYLWYKLNYLFDRYNCSSFSFSFTLFLINIFFLFIFLKCNFYCYWFWLLSNNGTFSLPVSDCKWNKKKTTFQKILFSIL